MILHVPFLILLELKVVKKLGLKVIKLEFILRLKIKHNYWLLADTCPQPPIIAVYFESKTVLKFYNLETRWTFQGHHGPLVFLCPQLHKKWRGILLWACLCLGSSVRLFKILDTNLTFHIWISPHKNDCPNFFWIRIISLCGVMPF